MIQMALSSMLLLEKKEEVGVDSFSAVGCFGPLAVTRVQFFSRQLAHSIRKASILRLQIRSCHAEEEDVWHSTSWLGVADKLH